MITRGGQTGYYFKVGGTILPTTEKHPLEGKSLTILVRKRVVDSRRRQKAMYCGSHGKHSPPKERMPLPPFQTRGSAEERDEPMCRYGGRK